MKWLYIAIKCILIIMLITNFISLAIFSLINPECYFFEIKISGLNALLYMLTNGYIGILVAYSLIKEKYGVIVALMYFGYNFLEKFFITHQISIIFTTGLLLSLFILIQPYLTSKVSYKVKE